MSRQFASGPSKSQTNIRSLSDKELFRIILKNALTICMLNNCQEPHLLFPENRIDEGKLLTNDQTPE